nr:hypothetical protein BdHM001_20540 [Bdellovibrio sp. HM001]BFD67259.1 hypothetical protein HAGR004_22810 [Bdellovibrio sp. HAGR004]
MKTAKLLSAVFLSSALLTTACTPKDEAITDKATRDRIIAQNNRKSGKGKKTGGQRTEFRYGSYSIASLQAEKVVEALEVIRLSLGHAEALPANYSKSEETKSGDLLQLSLNSATAPVAYSTKHGNFQVTVKKNWKVQALADANGVKSLIAETAKNSVSVDQKDISEKTYVNFKEDAAKISLVADAEGKAKVTVTGNGFMNISKKNVTGKETFTYSLEFTIRLDQLADGKIDLENASGEFVGVRKNGKNWVTSISGLNAKVTLDGQCNDVEGSVKIGKGDRPRVLQMTKSGAVVEKSSFDTDLGQCGRRPVVDLSRLLLN